MEAEQRSRLFWSACIPARIGLVFAVIYFPILIAPVLVVMGANMLYLYVSNSRLDAYEGGGETWWHKYRPFHGARFLLAGVLASQNHKYAYVPLVFDVAFGIYAHLFLKPT